MSTKRIFRRIFMVLVVAQVAGFGSACSSCDSGAKTSPALEPGTELVELGEVSGRTSETGDQASFDLVLPVKPSADVIVKFASSDPEEGLTDVTTLTFTPDNWDAPQTVTVTGQDDDVADGDQVYAVVFEPLESEDERFDGYEPGKIELTNVDDETAGITVSEPSGDTTEAGGQASFTVVLNSQPNADVTLTLESSNPEEGTIDKSSVTFTPDNWNAPQTITATGQDDDLADGAQVYEVVFGETESDDEEYAAITPASVELTNIDDETAGFTVSDPSGDTTEAGEQASFTVVLNSQPSDDVTLTLESSDSEEGAIDVSSLTFTPDNWNAPQTVTATGQDDDIADGNQVFEVVFVETTSGDDDYAAIVPPAVELTNIDDETPGFTVRQISTTANTTEFGGQARFVIVLNSKPFDDVTVNFDSSDLTEATVDHTSRTFTPENWNAPQRVTVNGQDDDLADGDQPFDVVFAATSSNDAAYAAITPQNIPFTNVDNDSAGITVSLIDGDTTEAGGQASFTVVLNSKPYGDVTLGFDTSDVEEATIDQTSLTFTDQNWNAPQTVTLTGQDDEYADGDQPLSVVFSATSSTDAAYAAITPQNVALTNVDNDSAGITVSSISGDTTEAGAQASFDVVLNSKPYGDVTLNFDTSDAGEGSIDKTSLTFTDQNWNAPQTVTLTGQNDDLADGDQPFNVTFSATNSTDAAYAAITPQNVAVTNTDDDSAGITVSSISGDTTEAGGQASFTVVLNSEPYEDVTVNFDTGDAGEGTVDTTSLTFTNQNWNAPKTVTLTGQNDDYADGDQPYDVVFSATTSQDAAYAAITPANVAVTNTDDDSAGITVSSISGDTSEAGGQASFDVVLNSRPYNDVTVNFDSSDTGEGTVGQSSLTFTDQNWNAPQTVTVTGQNDDLADGDQPFAIAFSATTSNDAAYAAITPQNVAVTNTDDDSAGITVSSISGDTTEAGGQASFTVVLNSEPYEDVTINFDSTDAGEGTVGQTSLTFTAQNWNAPQTVTVTGQNDDRADGDQPYAIAFTATTSNDAAYAAITPQNVAVTNTDDDSAGITVSSISGDTSEAGGQASFTVVLNSEPFDDVTVSFGSNDAGEGTVGQNSLTFTNQNWNAPQTVTLTGQDDDLDDGNQPYNVVFAATTSNDAAYAAITPQNVAVTNTDNDSAGITVSAVSGDTTEAGGQASFTVVLNSQPYDDVTVNFDTSDADEGTVGQTALTFTAQNWNAPQTVTLTGQNDDYADGDQPYNVVFSATTSNDAAYAAITPQNVAVTNTDDDSAGITVAVTDADSAEDGAQASLTIVLNSRPFDDVTVNFASSDTGEGITSRTSLTFTDQNWNAPQTVTVSGQDDNLDDGDQPYNVVFSATTSNDAAYAAITPQNVALTNTDDDSAGVTVSIGTATSTEDGGAATFSVVLNSEPFDDVTFNFVTNDASEGVPTANSLTITPANWNAPQNIVVQGQDDDLADNDQPYAITFGSTTSNDPAYAAITPQNVSLTNTDNDTAGIDVSAISGDTTEAGGQATFSAVLRSQPFDDVTVNFGSSDLGEGQVSTSSLTFTAANWNTPQGVTVTGQDDFVADGAQPYAITFSATTSNDAAYAAITPANISVTNTDDDTAGITVTPQTGTTSESGGQAIFNVVLNSEPTGDVTLTYAVSDSSEGSVSPASLTFTAANWNTAQAIQVTGVDDSVSDGNQSYTLNFNASSSSDGNYDGIVPAARSLSNVDNDSGPAVGTTGTTGRISGDEWIVCRADSRTAWVAANNGGEYNPNVACQSLGYSRADAWGGTCGTVCGYCRQQGNEYYGGGGGNASSLAWTVHWRCTQ